MQSHFLEQSKHKFILKLKQLPLALACSSLLIGSSLLSAWPNVAIATQNIRSIHEPLLMEGKTTLYQRVLTTPSCLLYKNPNLKGQGETVPAFSQFYIYEDLDKVYHVGTNAVGDLAGYLSKDCVVPWKQQLAMLFTNSAGRSRALIFKDEASLDSYIDQEDGAERYKKVYDQVLAGNYVEDVISIEPEKYVDFTQNFYLLPILNSTETMFLDGAYTYKHQIASITSDTASSNSTYQAKQQANQQVKQQVKQQSQATHQTTNQVSNQAMSQDAKQSTQQSNRQSSSNSIKAQDASDIVGFKSAVVFVIDSSISMQPYIDRTKQAINTIYKSIEASHLSKSVHFGIVSFRADVTKVPGLEYTSKMYLRPGEALNASEFNQKVAKLEQAKVSSAQFDEDAYAGINLALQDINWKQYGGRYIVLITDAGAIDGSSAQSSTGLDANALRIEAEHQGAAIYAMHLLTPSGKKNHKKAQAQYENLSFNQVLNKPLYYPVNAGSVKTFGENVEVLANAITEQVELASLGELSAGSALSAKDQASANPQLAEDSRKLGLAMQLAFLGRVQGTKSPEFLQGYISDHDITDHNKLVSMPIVLVNRNQLSDLYTLVKGVLEAGIAGQLSSDDMFAQLQALAAQMGRDPNQLSKSKSLAQMDILGELLDDLPYKSRIASLSPDDWYNLGSQEQENIIRSLENSLKYIQFCNSDNDRWLRLNEKADETEAVYPMPLDALP